MGRALRVLLLFCTILLVTGNAWALPVEGDIVRMGYGDIYQMTVTQSAISDTIGDSYDTFCLERWVYFTNGTSYRVESVIDYATGGGGGVFDPSVGDPVSQETKWLFAAYRTNLLGSVTAQTVQNAIWYLEGEGDHLASSWIDNFLSLYLNSDVAGLLSAWDIKAVNIVSLATGADRQSQLVGSAAPVPEPATMLLLGTGLIGMAGLGRKKFKI